MKPLGKKKDIRKHSGNIRLHRTIYEEYIGRKLTSNEVIHHINGDCNDNKIENLNLMSKKDHDNLSRAKRVSDDAIITYLKYASDFMNG
jgi:hypothetical protein